MKKRLAAALLGITATMTLAAEPPNPLNRCSATRQTRINEAPAAVLQAAATGDLALLRSALRDGLSPDSTDREGFALLHIGITEKQDEVVDLLLASGADPNLPFKGSSPLSLARASVSAGERQAHDLQRLELLKQAGARLSDQDEALFELLQLGLRSLAAGFVDAIRRDDLERVRLHVRATHDINAALVSGATPLHVAALQGGPAVVRYLVGCGANLDARSKHGAPVLWYARSRPEIRALLIELGATVED